MDRKNWNVKPLGEVAEFLDGKRVPLKDSDRAEMKGDIPYYGANGQIDSINKYIFDEPLILLAEDGGHFGSKTKPIAYKITGKSWVNNHAHVLKPKNGLDLDYLKWSLSYYDVTKHITGSTRLKLTKGDAAKMPIPLPDLKTQQQIAHTLEQADAARQKRKQALALTEQFLQSAFLEMFGDPVRNEKGWEVKNLEDFTEFMTSGSRGWARYYSDTGDIFIRIENVGRSKLFLEEEKLQLVNAPESAESKRTEVKVGDLLISITADLGRTAVVPKLNKRAYINQHLALVRLNGLVNPIFLSHYFSTQAGQSQFQSKNKGGVKAGLNFNDIKSLKFILPPLALQEEFAALVERVEQLRHKQRESEKELENLFGSLMGKYFG